MISKNPLILLVGLASDQMVWEHQIHWLRDIAEIKVISCHQNTPEAMVGFILEQAPRQFALAGHSMGGWLALEIMRRAPDRVTKLCLLNTTAEDDPPEKVQRRNEMIQMAKTGQYPEVARTVADAFVFNSSVKEKILAMFLRQCKGTFINQQFAMLAREESMSILPKIVIPTLVIYARQDKNFTLAMHERIVKQIPDQIMSFLRCFSE